MMLVLQDPHNSSISSTWEPYSAFFQPCICHPHFPTKTILFSDERRDIPNWALFPILVPIELFQIAFPTRGPQVGVRTGFVQEEPLGLRCLSKILATCVVEDASLQGVRLAGLLRHPKPGMGSFWSLFFGRNGLLREVLGFEISMLEPNFEPFSWFGPSILV